MLLGCDLVLVPRIAKLIKNDNFLLKVFNLIEIEYCQAKNHPAESFAARFAAKEAVAKAIGTGIYAEGIIPTDFWIQNTSAGKPLLQFSPKMIAFIQKQQIKGSEVSLSHQGDYAMAVVIFF